jgi:hypothetical protein
MAYSKGEVNRAGRLIAENLPVTTQAEIDHRRAAVEVVDWWRGEHAQPLTLVAANLRYYAAKVGEPVVAQRLKRLPTIADKLIRLPTMKLAAMGDIGGVRAVVPDQKAAYYVARQLRKNWTITRFRDYVVEPKADGYRALHLVNRHRGRLIEVQLRTRLQDSWANFVEALTSSVAPGLKYGQGPPGFPQLLVALSSLDAELETGKCSPDAALTRQEEILSQIATLVQEPR